MCAGNGDCQSGKCVGGVCQGLLTLPNCTDMAVTSTRAWDTVISKQCGMGCHLLNASLINWVKSGAK